MHRKPWQLLVSVASCATGIGLVATKSDEQPTKFRPSSKHKRERANPIEKVARYVERFQVERGVPGLTIAVSVDGATVWQAGFGYSNVETLTKCQSDTSMRIASISKPITMAIAAKLWQDGHLDLDAPISQYLPDFPAKKWQGQSVDITARQLACHRGGIRHYHKKKDTATKANPCATESMADKLADMEEYNLNRKFKSVSESLSLFKDDELVSKPGTTYLYTTHGYTLLSAVMEKAAGRLFDRLLRETLDLFGMDSTMVDENSLLIPNRAS